MNNLDFFLLNDDSDSSEESVSSFVTSSSDSDDYLEENERKKNENYLENIVPQYSDEVFMEHFRISRIKVDQLAEEFKNSEYFHHQHGRFGKISAKYQLLIYFWFVGHQTASYRDVADRFDITISSLYRICHKVTYFFSNQSYRHITWPDNEEKVTIEQHFRRKNGFPGIIGVIDGTHIRIDKPDEDPDSYINRKGYYSIQLQIVCDNSMRIRDLFVGYPGSVHDSRVFRTSPLYQNLQQNCGEYHILGDSGYPLLPNLLTPFKAYGPLNRRQLNYNTKLSQNRIIVEHTIGVLKQRFRQLFHLKLRNMRLLIHLIRATAVLHNICLGDNFHRDQEIPLEVGEINQINNEDDDQDNNIDGVQKRNQIVAML